MEIYRIEVMPIGTNCYLAYDKDTKEGIVIDPGGSPELIGKAIDQLGIQVKAIIDTHGHWDHIGANRAVKEKTGAPVYIHGADQDYLADPKFNMSSMMGTQTTTDPAEGLLNEGDLIRFGSCSLKVIHTPGHTPGGISLYGHDVVFCGDTLFYRSIGRTDLPGGNYQQLNDSIRDKLFSLPDDTLVCPGHGIMSRIGDEKNGNPFVR
jgi:glyoxylase-like metal-dependent hydrolase (beta-lactamase superfamily II)